jgi:orotate phosphoribosyltransferase
MALTSDEILAMFKSSGALLEGHFQLTSGLHSPRYFQCAKVLQYPRNNELLCGLIAARFGGSKIDVVIAPALGGIVVGQEVGRQVNARTIFAERQDRALQLRRGFHIGRGERVLVCEDVITTGGSVSELLDIITGNGGLIVGVGAIVDRSGGAAKLPGLFAALKMESVTYRPDSCPLCQAGIPVVKPGSRPATPG